MYPEGPIRLSVSLPQDAPAKPEAHFSGPAGHWLILGSHGAHHEARITLVRGDIALCRILMLLSGGALTLEPAAEDEPILSLPESGANGRDWFACARVSVN